MRFGLRHLALIVTTVLALGLNASALLRQPAAVDQAANRAGLVISFGDGRVQQQQCISFTEAEITGYDLLRKSTLPVVANQFGGLGAAICKIDTVGCNYPQEDCFCQSVNRPSAEQRSWFFWTLQNGVWVSSNAGTSSARVTNGVVHGWVWGPGNPGDPAKTFDQICNTAPTAIPTALSADLIGGGQVISSAIAPPAPTAVVVANAPTVPAAPPTSGVTVVAVVAALVPTATPVPPASTTAAPALTVTPMPTLTPTVTTEPTPSSTSTITSTYTTTFTDTITSTATPTPTLTTEPSSTSTSTITTTLTSTYTTTFTNTITSTSAFTASSTSAPTPMPTSTPPPPETPPASNPLGYVLFGVIALGLAGGIVLTRVRK